MLMTIKLLTKGMESDFGDDFGQKVDLTVRIREILSHYPPGISVLKEFVQNADDAGARVLRMCVDKRQHPRDTLPSHTLEHFQGPCLLVFNDAVFSDRDFESICNIGNSVKKLEVAKTGRFGLGFNAVYHLTDLPSFASRNRIVFFDPHAQFLPGVNPANPGKTINFLTSPAVTKYPDFFKPFSAFGFDLSSEFNGTLFRLPLRTVEQAARSRLSSSPQTGVELEGFLREFAELIPSCLLFLKSLTSVELSVWNEGSPKEEVFFRSACNLSEESRKMREAIPYLLTQVAVGSIQPYPNQETNVDVTIESTSSVQGVQTSVSQRFLVCSNLGGKIATATALNPASSALRFVPFASIACALNAHNHQDSVELIKGRAFCFLPLPTQTGLPVHVNGAFELSSNRRDVWFGDDMAGEGLLRAQWNKVLLEDVAVPAYLRLLELASAHMSPAQQMQLWPVKCTGGPWEWIATGVFRGSLEKNILYSPGSLSWISPRDAIFLHSEAFHDNALMRNTVLRILCEMKANVVDPNAAMMECFNATQGFSPRCSEPVLLIDMLQKNDVSLSFADSSCLLPFLFHAFNSNSFEASRLISLKILPVFGNSVVAVPRKGDPKPCVLVPESMIPTISRSNLLYAVVGWERAGVKDVFVSDSFQSVCEVRPLLPVDVPLILCGVLGEKCRNQEEVRWEGLVERAWLESLWDKVLKQGVEWVSACSEWPVFPTSMSTMVSARSASLRLMSQSTASKFSDILPQLSHLGFRTLEESILVAVPSFISKFCIQSSAANLLSSLALNPVFQDLILSLSEEHTIGLRRFFLNDVGRFPKEWNGQSKQTLCQFRIHSCYVDTQFHALDLNSHRLPPYGIPLPLLTNCFVVTDSETELSTYVSLGIPRLGRAEWYRLHFLPAISGFAPAERDEAVLEMLERLAELCREDAGFEEHLRKCAFLSSGSQELRLVSDLYDPAQSELSGLLDSEKEYPGLAFRREDVLGVLRRLGLKRELNRVGLINIISGLKFKADHDKFDIGCRVLIYLEKHFERLAEIRTEASTRQPSASSASALHNQSWSLSNMMRGIVAPARSAAKVDPADEAEVPGPAPSQEALQFVERLCNLSWMPVLVNCPTPELPWVADPESVACPSVTRPVEEVSYVSSTMRLSARSVSNPNLRRAFGWDRPPPIVCVARQLCSLSVSFDQASSNLDHTRIRQIVHQIYNALDAGRSLGHIHEVVNILNQVPCIWIGSLFVLPSCCALKSALNAAPYICVLPAELLPLSELFKALGCREQFAASDYSRALKQLAATEKDARMQGEKLQWSVLMVQLAAAAWNGVNSNELESILVPDFNGFLLPAEQLVYNDAPWIEDANVDNIKFSHPRISNEVCELVGVRSLRRQLLLKFSDVFSMGIYDAEAFGQSESLTGRLKHILELYAEGPGILYELIQNADDAGASEVCIALCTANFESESIIGPGMKDLQGPSLYFYNNAEFTPKDFKALATIGHGAKLDESIKTGRFGLGFNAVYHFTDVPSFVSGDYVVFFDPHSRFVPGATVAQPGVRIKFTSNDLARQFHDQFLPYLLFGCDMKQRFKGTLFRFPLRIAALAERSDIKKKETSVIQVQDMIDSFINLGPSTLLFLKHVKKIKVCRISAPGQTPQLVSSFELKHSSPTDSDSCAKIPAFMQSSSGACLPRQSVIEKLSSLSTSQSLCAEYKIRIDIQDERQSPGIIRSQFSYEEWLIVSKFGSAQSIKMAIEHQSLGLRFVPWASVAAKLSCSSDRSLIDGRAFCFLPLPTQTGLPVHVNGAFELSSNRRDVWFGDDMAGEGLLRAQWNKVLLEDVAVPAYLRLLELASAHMSPAQQMQLWPVKCTGGPWEWILSGVYTRLAQECLFWSEGSQRWVNAGSSILISESCPVRPLLETIYSRGAFHVVKVPLAVEGLFSKYGGPLKMHSPASLRSALRAAQSNQNFCLVTADAHDLLPIAFADVAQVQNENPVLLPAIYQSLIGLRLLPTHGDAVVAVPRKGDPKPCVLVPESMIPTISRSNLLYAVVGWERAGVKDVFVSDSFQSVCEVRPLLPVDVPLILCGVLGEKCRNQEEVRWEGLVERAWLESLWDKVLKQGVEWVSACSEWPVVPVASAMGLMLCRSKSKNSRVLNRIPQVDQCVVEALLLLGVRFADSSLIHSSFESWSTFFCDSSTGVLDALVHCFGTISEMNQRVRSLMSAFPATVTAFRNLMLIQQPVVLANGDLLSSLDLPIHQTATSSLCALDPKFNILPPSKVPVSLLSKCFVVPSSDAESAAYRVLGLRNISRAEWYRLHFLPAISGFAPAERDEAVLEMLERLAELCREDAGFEEHLRKCAFLSSGSQELRLVSDLYDPAQSELSGLLDSEKEYPGLAFRREDVLGVLRRLGLRRSLDKEAVLRAADRISKSEGPTRKPSGAKLFCYLDSQSALVGSLLTDDDACDCLRMIDWVPVDDAPPLAWLPVSTRNRVLGVAAPVVVRPIKDACLISFSYALCSLEVKSESFLRLLQWHEPPPSRLIAAQLMKMADVVNKLPPESNLSYSDVLNQYTVILAHFEEVRQKENPSVLPPGWIEAKSPEGKPYFVNPTLAKTQWERPEASTSSEFKSVMAVLNDLEQPLVLVCKHHAGVKHPLFVAPRFVAFSPVFESPPFLNRFPADLMHFAAVFKALNVKQSFDVEDMLKSLSVAAADFGSSPVPPEYRPSVIRTIMSMFPEVCVLLEGAHVMRSCQLPEQQKESDAALRQKISLLELKFDLAPPSRVFILDEAGHLIPANALNVDDAPWLSTSLRQSGSARFVHSDIVPNVAIALGCISLRTALIGGSVNLKSLPCNGYSQTEDILSNRSAGDNGVLLELMEAADVLGARSMHVMLDCRPHPNVRLLDPRCASCQGPAVVLFLPNTVLTIEHICRMLGRNDGDQPLFALSSSDLISRCRIGAGLLSGFRLTDLMSVVSGDALYMFSPTGAHLSAENTTPTEGVGKFHKFAGTDLHEKFPDQFAPFKLFGFSPLRMFNGTLIRLPLRTTRPSSSARRFQRCIRDEEILSIMRAFESRQGAPFSLVTCSFLESVAVHVWPVGESNPSVVYECNIVPPITPAMRHERSRLFLDREWARFNLSNLTSLVTGGSSTRSLLKELRVKLRSFSHPNWTVEPMVPDAAAIRHEDVDASVDGADEDAEFASLVCSSLAAKPAAAAEKNLDADSKATTPPDEPDNGSQSNSRVFCQEIEWIVVGCLASKQCAALNLAKENHQRGFMPLVITAVPVKCSGVKSSDVAKELMSYSLCSRICAFDTPSVSLPFLISGYFEAAKGRNGCYIPFGTQRQNTSMSVDELWNNSLIEVASDCCGDLLKHLFLTKISFQDMSLFWPILDSCAPIMKDALTNSLKTKYGPNFMLPLATGNAKHPFEYKSIKDCFFPHKQMPSSLLAFVGNLMPVFHCPSVVGEELHKLGINGLQFVNPAALRHKIRKHLSAFDRYWQDLPSSKDVTSGVRECFLGELAAFLVCDVAEGHAGPSDVKDLLDVPFLLTLQPSQTLKKMPANVLASDRDDGGLLLLPRQESILLHPCMSKLFSSLIRDQADPVEFSKRIGISPLDPATFAQQLERILPVRWKGKKIVEPDSGSTPSQSWFLAALQFVYSCPDQNAAFSRWLADSELKDWPLLPLANGKLLSCQHADKLLLRPEGAAESNFPLWAANSSSSIRSEHGRVLYSAAVKLGCPIVAPGFECFVKFYDESRMPWIMLSGLEHCCTGRVEALTPHEADTLHSAFSSAVASGRVLNEAETRRLRQLPIYTSATGSHRAIDDANGVNISFVVPQSLWSNVSMSCSLVSAPGDHLLSALRIPELNEIDVFEKCMLPQFSSGNADSRSEILNFTLQHWARLRGSASVCAALRDLDFVTVEGAESVCVKPAMLLDPDVSLLRHIFDGEPEFPGGVFALPRWLSVLRELGLKSRIDGPLFTASARRLQLRFRDEVKSHSDSSMELTGTPLSVIALLRCDQQFSLWSLALSLCEYLDGHFADVFTAQLAADLCHVQFVPAEVPSSCLKVSSQNIARADSLNNGYQMIKTFVRFQDAILPCDRLLAFTASPVLASSITPPHALRPGLAICSPPSASTVIAHMRTLAANSGPPWPYEHSAVSIYAKILEYWSECWEAIGASLRLQIRKTPSVPVAGSIITADRLFFDLPNADAVKPLLFVVPRQFMTHEKLLREMGARDSPHVEDLAVATTSLALATHGRPLTINELEAASAILELALLDIESADPLVVSRFMTKTTSRSAPALHGPDINSCLRPLASLLYNDDCILSSRLRSSAIGLLHSRVSKTVVNALNIPCASAAICELVTSFSDATDAASWQGIGLGDSDKLLACESVKAAARHVTSALRSPRFARAIFLAMEQAQNASMEEESIRLALQRSTCIPVLNLAIELRSNMFDGDGSSDSSPPPAFSIERSTHRIYTLLSASLFKSGRVPDNSAIVFALASGCVGAVMRVLAWPSIDKSVVLSCLMCAETQDNIGSMNACGILVGEPPDGFKRGTCGAELSAVDEQAVISDPGREWRIGEAIAYRDARQKFRYGRVKRVTPGGADAAGLSRVLIQRYPEDTGVFMISHSFSAFRYSVNAASMNEAEDPLARPSSDVISKGSLAVSGGASRTSATASPASSHASAPESITRKDVIGALKSLMVAAGLPMSMDQEKLVETVMQLKASMAEERELRRTLEEHLNEKAGEIERLKSAFTCGICFTEDVSVVLVPCGHRLCGECLLRCASKCPYCRARFTSNVPFYKSDAQ